MENDTDGSQTESEIRMQGWIEGYDQGRRSCRVERLYQAYENLLDVLMECIESNTSVMGGDDEDYLNVRAEHVAAYHLHVVNGDTEGAKRALLDSLYFMGHEDDCPVTAVQLDETGHYKYGDDQDDAAMHEALIECKCTSLYERDLQDKYLVFARNFYLRG